MVLNSLQVKKVDLTKTEHVEKVVQEELKARNDGKSFETEDQKSTEEIMTEITFIGEKITEGANSFLAQEYLYLGIFSAAFAILLGCTVDLQEMGRDVAPTNFPYTAVSFIAGCATSILAGYIGMTIAVYTNSRTTFGCCESVDVGFNTAFKGGQVLGFVLVGLALLVLEIVVIVIKASWFDV